MHLHKAAVNITSRNTQAALLANKKHSFPAISLLRYECINITLKRYINYAPSLIPRLFLVTIVIATSETLNASKMPLIAVSLSFRMNRDSRDVHFHTHILSLFHTIVHVKPQIKSMPDS